jgi:hypothetical protein
VLTADQSLEFVSLNARTGQYQIPLLTLPPVFTQKLLVFEYAQLEKPAVNAVEPPQTPMFNGFVKAKYLNIRISNTLPH